MHGPSSWLLGPYRPSINPKSLPEQSIGPRINADENLRWSERLCKGGALKRLWPPASFIVSLGGHQWQQPDQPARSDRPDILFTSVGGPAPAQRDFSGEAKSSSVQFWLNRIGVFGPSSDSALRPMFVAESVGDTIRRLCGKACFDHR